MKGDERVVKKLERKTHTTTGLSAVGPNRPTWGALYQA